MTTCLEYYVENYHVVLPAEFLAHVQTNGWNVPTSLDIAQLEELHRSNRS